MDNYNYSATVSETLQQHYDMLIFFNTPIREQVFFVLIRERHNVMFTNIFFPAGNPERNHCVRREENAT